MKATATQTAYEEDKPSTRRYQTDAPLKLEKILRELVEDKTQIIYDSSQEQVYRLKNPAVNVIVNQAKVEVRGNPKEVNKAEKILYFQIINSGVKLEPVA